MLWKIHYDDIDLTKKNTGSQVSNTSSDTDILLSSFHHPDMTLAVAETLGALLKLSDTCIGDNIRG